MSSRDRVGHSLRLDPDELHPGFARTSGAGRDSLLFSRIKRFNEKSAVRTARYKLIHTVDKGTNAFCFAIRPGYELYDLQSDPGERLNVYSERPA